MWIDATIAASFITDPKQSKVADKVAFAQGPLRRDAKGCQLAVGLGTGHSGRHQERGRRSEVHLLGDFQDYINLVAKTNGWAHVPTGTRKSTYANPEFQKAAVFAAAEKAAIDILPTPTTARCLSLRT